MYYLEIYIYKGINDKPQFVITNLGDYKWVTGQLVALVISSPRTAGQLVAKTRRENEKLISADHTKYNKAIRDRKYLAPPHASAWQHSRH